MAFIRAKKTANKTAYYQLVENNYREGKVRQKVLKHLGGREAAEDYAASHGLSVPEVKERKNRWKRAWARRYTLQKLDLTARGFLDTFKKKIGATITSVLVVSEGSNRAFYVDEDEWNGIGKRVLGLCSRDKAWRTVYEETLHYSRHFESYCLKLAGTDLPAATNRSLAVAYKEFMEVHVGPFEYYLWLPFFVDEFVLPELRDGLTWEFGAKTQDALLAIVSPSEMNKITLEGIALGGLAIKVKEGNLGEQKASELLEEHAEEFGWLAVYDFDEAPWGVEHFESRLEELCYKRVEELKKEAGTTRRKYLENDANFKRILKKTKSCRLRNLALTAHAFAFLKDARDDYRRHGNYLAEKLYGEIARRAGLSLAEVVQLSCKEILSFLRSGHLDRSVIRERLKGVTLTLSGRKLEVFTGKKAVEVAKKELPEKEEEREGFVKGIPASPGKARGPARVIRHKLLLHKVRAGDVLVSNTTMPDYVPAMKKSVAVVTNEGGITCHAAIVCRELKIPCVVGTRTATREFEDGDLVEVDATKGIVKRVGR